MVPVTRKFSHDKVLLSPTENSDILQNREFLRRTTTLFSSNSPLIFQTRFPWWLLPSLLTLFERRSSSTAWKRIQCLSVFASSSRFSCFCPTSNDLSPQNFFSFFESNFFFGSVVDGHFACQNFDFAFLVEPPSRKDRESCTRKFSLFRSFA